jgi:hypothetical protein
MKATAFSLSGKSIIQVTHEGNLHQPNTLITVEGRGETEIVKGILRMLQDDQCSECGKFNGLHGEVYHAIDSCSGEVKCYYEMCSKGTK